MTPILTFSLLLLATLGWMAVPLIPAVLEFLRPRDAAPLDAVGNDAGGLTYFAESFTARCEREGLLDAITPPRLTDGSAIRRHSALEPLGPKETPVGDLVVVMDDTPVPGGITLAGECLARESLRGGARVTYRALLGQGDLQLGAQSTVLRWAHAEGRLEIGDGSQLFGRATAGSDLVLGSDVRFERLDAPVVRVTDEPTVEPPVYPLGAYGIFFIPNEARPMGPQCRSIERGLRIPSRVAYTGSFIVKGDIVIEDGALVTGSLKAHGDVIIRANAVVQGSVTARGRIVLDSGALVAGTVISETAVLIGAATVGSRTQRTTVTAPTIQLQPGATIYGAVMAADAGRTAA